jgi:hypothetical protein
MEAAQAATIQPATIADRYPNRAGPRWEVDDHEIHDLGAIRLTSGMHMFEECVEFLVGFPDVIPGQVMNQDDRSKSLAARLLFQALSRNRHPRSS